MHGLWVKYSPRPLSRQGRGFFTQRLTLQISRSVHGNESSWLLIESQEELEGSRMGVVLALICVVVIIVSPTTVLWKKQSRDQRWTMEQHAISPEQLYSLLGSHQDVALFDVRQPLDLLAHSEIIPGARRIPPADLLTAPSLIPKDKEAIVYCTCPGDKTGPCCVEPWTCSFSRSNSSKAASKLGKRRAIRSSPTGRFSIFIHPTLFSIELGGRQFSHLAEG
jgi:hypothetical protein